MEQFQKWVPTVCFIAMGCSNNVAPATDAATDARRGREAMVTDTTDFYCSDPTAPSTTTFADLPAACPSQSAVDCVAWPLTANEATRCNVSMDCVLCKFVQVSRCATIALTSPCHQRKNCMVGCANSQCPANDSACWQRVNYRPDGACYSFYQELTRCINDAVAAGQCADADNVCVLPNSSDSGVLDSGTRDAEPADAARDAGHGGTFDAADGANVRAPDAGSDGDVDANT